MPNHRFHNNWDQRFLGCKYGRYSYIHQYLDYPQKWLGPRHRAVNHDMNTVYLIHYMWGYTAACVAWWHIWWDFWASNFKKEIREFKREKTKTPGVK